MSVLRHIGILTWKNFAVIKRSKLWLFFEMVFGLLLIPLFFIIVMKATNEISESRIYKPVNITGDYNDISRNVPSISRISSRMCNKNVEIGFVYPKNINDTMIRLFEERYSQARYKIVPHMFTSLEQMRKELYRDLNQTTDSVCGKYIGGIYISTLDVEKRKFDYRIFVRDWSESDWHTSQFWPDDGPYGALNDLNSIPSSPPYWSNGFLSFQLALDSIFLDMVGKPNDTSIQLNRFPTPPFRSNGILAILKAMPVLFVMLVVGVMLHTTKEIVSEKESGIRTHLLVMGLDSVAFYASHFVIAFIKIFIIMGIASIILAVGFESISPFIFVPFCLIFGVAAILISILVAVCSRRSSIAILAVLIIWFGLFILDTYLKISPTRIGVCFLGSLNVFTAFHLGLLAMSSYESRLINLNWLNVFAESTISFSIGCAFLMLIVDILIMCLLIYYFDVVWPTDDSPRKHPLFFLPWVHKKDLAEEVDLDSNNDTFTENCQPDSGIHDEADISVRKMTKIYETGQVAVDGLTFDAYRGQVTVLLGHNGAGKSTTFSVISGISASTRGEVLICNKSISSQLTECQKEIGFCPQYNPLFERLTVEEHLRLYGKLKTDTWDHTCEEKITKLLHANNLIAKRHELAGGLSGGMKRKLCVAMALIGDSKVVLLDEPTAGMDPEARQDVVKMLEAEKRTRTILLTTHYMDEADLLGDQIAIMFKGRLICKGSPEYLKNKFGTGYVLTLVIEAPANFINENSVRHTRNALLAVIKKHAPKAEIESTCGMQFSVILPTENKNAFANLFEELEKSKSELGLSSFGLSFNTLEQVFLRVGEMAETPGDEEDGEGVAARASSLFGHRELEASPSSLFLHQVAAILYRYFVNAYRNKIRTLFPIVFAALLFSFIAFGSSSTTVRQERDLSLINQEALTIPMQLSQDEKIAGEFSYIAGKIPWSNPITFPQFANLSNEVLKHAYDSPALGIGVQVMNNTLRMFFNGAAYHGPPLALSFLSNAILGESADSITASVEVYSSDNYLSSQEDGASVKMYFANMLTILCFSFLTSLFVMPLVDDRISRFKHQLLLTKLNQFTYWFSVTLFFLIIYTVFCFILSLILFFSGWMETCLEVNILFWALYFWAATPFAYVASFVFTSPVRAFAAMLSYNLIAGLVATIAIAVVMALQISGVADILVVIFSVMLPSFALGRSVIEITVQCPIIGYIHQWNTLNKVIICMVISGFFWWGLLFLLEHSFERVLHFITRRFRRGYEALSSTQVDPADPIDEDVRNEQKRMNDTSDEELALSVRDVSKYFGDFCALRRLTFGVNPTDCFGLLGVNGAGKTTTFDILTGRALATSGNAHVSGVDIRKMPVIGYCPQFDALATDLTGRQTLTILGKLNAFNDVEQRVNKVLESIQMTAQADKLVLHYSGGQKRRLSIGVTLMSRASLIMLDEPTAGIDPKTRRHIWNLLSAVRDQKVAILLTSHSMDECEALCSRIGFLNKGSLISIGTSQHLKSRYGNSFLLTFTVLNPSVSNLRYLDSIVSKEFGAEPTQDLPHMNVLHWDIPRRPGDSWSNLYRRAQDIADRHPQIYNDTPIITDFSVTQNSLEQVFLRLTQLGASLEDQSTRSTTH